MIINPNLYALLIGIDRYTPNKLPDGSYYPDLSGCVRDVLQLEEVLKKRWGRKSEHILKLTAPSSAASSVESQEDWPTYENMVAAFKKLTDVAQPGDQVYIHYSGPGRRASTMFPEIKGRDGLDNSLVPADIGKLPGRYLRDVELLFLIKRMVAKGLIVTLVLDTCYSGVLTRGMGGAAVRCIPTVDTTRASTDSLVAAREELIQSWPDSAFPQTGRDYGGSGWFPEWKGHVLLAACHSSESAYEYAFNGQERNGVLTYWLLDSLRRSTPDLTFRQLHNRIVAKIHSQFVQQTAQLEGEFDRTVFFGQQEELLPFEVLQVDTQSQRVLIKAGQDRDIRPGSRLIIYPPGQPDLGQTDKSLVLAEIEKVGPTESWAKLSLMSNWSKTVEPGARAVHLDPEALLRLSLRVRLVRQSENPLTPSIDQDSALNQIAEALKQENSRLINLVADDYADYQVAVNPDSEYEIWDPAGNLIPNLRPALRTDDHAAPARLVQRLIHLSKYRNVLMFENNNVLSPLAGKILIELNRLPPDYEPGSHPIPQMPLNSGSPLTFNVGDRVMLRVCNTSQRTLAVSLLDLQPDWAISEVHPNADVDHALLEPGEQNALTMPLQVALPSGFQQGTDVIKAFATIAVTSFRWLELPPIDQPSIRTRGIGRGSANPLEELLAVNPQDAETLDQALLAAQSVEWTTAQIEVRIQAQKSPEEQIEELDVQIVKLFLEGNYEKAIEIATQARDLIRQHVGEHTTAFASNLNTVATLFKQVARYEAAEPLYLQSLDIHRALGEEDKPEYAESLNNLAELYRETARYGEAEALYQQALEIHRVRFSQGSNKRDYSITLNNLALLYEARGDFLKAEELLIQARDVVKDLSGESHPDFAAVTGNLGELYRLMGRYDDAEDLLKHSLKIIRTAMSENSPALPSKLNNLGLLYKDIGDYDVALPLFAEAMSILRTSQKTNHPDFAQTINNLAELYRAIGRYTEAETLYKQALEIKSRSLGPTHPSYGESLNNLAELYTELGKYSEANSLYSDALKIRSVLGDSHPDYAATLLNMAKLQHVLGRYDEAERLYQQALDIQRKVLTPDHLDTARTLSNLAELYLETSKHAAAQSLYEQALKIRRTVLGSDNPEVAVSFCDLARAHRRMGDYAAAEPLYRQAYQIQRISLGEEHPAFVQTLNSLAVVLAATGREKDAMELAQRALGIEDSMIELIFSIGSERQRKMYITAIEDNFNMFLSLVLQYFKGSAAAIREIFDLVLRRKAIMVEALAAQRELTLIDRYPGLDVKLRDLISLRTQIAQKILQTPGGLIAQQQLLNDWNTQKERLEGELAHEIPEIKLSRRLRSVERRSVAHALPEKSVLVEFVRLNVYNFQANHALGEPSWKSPRYLAFVLPAREPDKVQLVDLGEAEPIDKLVNAFRASISNTSNDPPTAGGGLIPESGSASLSAGEHANDLRTAVFDPLVPLLEDQTYLLLAPASNLVNLSFAALPLNEGYLIDKYHFSYLHTGRDALRFEILPTSVPTETLIIADPDYDLATSTKKKVRRSGHGMEGLSTFVRLPGTRVEGELVASILQVRPWLGDKALKKSLKAFRSPRILHVAAHGFFLADRPREINHTSLDFGTIGGPGGDGLARLRSQGAEHTLRQSGIALAGANTWLRGGDPPSVAEDGLLTAEEILNLDLSGTELVTLSACQTGYGERVTNESVVSLQRAFLLAGAKMLVMNLWQVPDEQTAELMQEFYRRIAEGKSQSRALQQAQSAIRQKFPSPYYWGAFVCLGDLAPLPVQKTEFVRASNPYVTGLPVTSDNLFVGRGDVLKIIQDNLAPAAGQNILLLRGQRRTGKTSVLLRLAALLKKDTQSTYLPVYIDVQGLTGSKDESEFFSGIALNMGADLLEVDVQVPQLTGSDFDESPRNTFKFKFLKPITERLGNRRLLLMLDEFDRIKTLIDDKKLNDHVLDFFRHLMQHASVLFLIAGTYKLLELTGEYYSVFFNLAVPITIGKLPEKDTRELITEPVKPWYTIESLAVDEIVRVAGCHPYFTQLVCKTLLDVRNESGLNEMTITYVEEAVKRALESGEQNIGYPWTETDCSSDERLVLAIMASEDKPTTHVSLASISEQLAAAKISLTIGKVVKRLTERGIIQQDDQTRLTFVVPLFQRWLVQKRYDSLATAIKYNDEHSTPTNGGGHTDV
ncbi:MAG: tetratricopeptide repeat protein [Pyrinomonadaceae bacterium]|nr:tetratricopeptide repeat protein [Pyrinomonadaceae bacterium]